MSQSQQVYKTAKEMQVQFGPVDILVNNAGIVQYALLQCCLIVDWCVFSRDYLREMDDNKMQSVMATNALAHFWTVKAMLPQMVERNSMSSRFVVFCVVRFAVSNCLCLCRFLRWAYCYRLINHGTHCRCGSLGLLCFQVGCNGISREHSVRYAPVSVG